MSTAVTYTWKVNNLTELNEIKNASFGQSFPSPTFSAFGCKWGIQVCPNGRDGLDGTRDKISIFLNLLAAPANMKNIRVEFKLRFPNYTSILITKTFSRIVIDQDQSHSWGAETGLATASIQHCQSLALVVILHRLIMARDANNKDVSQVYRNKPLPPQKTIAIIAKHEQQWHIADQSLLQQIKTAKLKQVFRSASLHAFGCKFHLTLYPNGKDVQGFVFLSLHAVLPPSMKAIAVICRLECEETSTVIVSSAYWTGPKGWGWNKQILPTKNIQECATLTFKAHLRLTGVYDVNDCDVTAQYEQEWAQLREKEKMYELGKEHGDLVLVVDSSNEDDLEKPRAKKKRRLNEDEAQEEPQLKVGGLMLRAASEVFNNMLASDFKERQENKITVHAKSVRDIDDMWYFICTGRLREDCDSSSLVDLAHLYDLKMLFQQCVDRMIENLGIENFAHTVLVFDKYGIKHEYEGLLKFASTHLDELNERDDFLELPNCFRRCVEIAMKK